MDAHLRSHPTPRTLSAYGLGKLDDRSAGAVDKHLEQCAECRKRVAEMSADSFLGRIREARIAASHAMSEPSQPSATESYTGMNDEAPPSADTFPPDLADHPDYEIKRELGRGGMGVVYLAHHKWMGRDEVLKVMGRHIMERRGVLERFQREIKAVAKLRHPNIVTAYHATRIGESLVFAMEYVDGYDLAQLVKGRGPLPVALASNFVYQAALGLQHAHEEGLVHRDIKPGNLMLARKGDKATVKVLDFGLARATRGEKVDTALTSEGQALGTPDFISPEQILDAASADIRADVYSLGGTLFCLLAGRPPFQGNSAYDVYQGHISRDAGPLNLIRPEVPVELAAIVAKMLAKEPGRRFQTPGEVAESLKPFFKKASVTFKEPRVVASPTAESTVAEPTGKEVSAPPRSEPKAGRRAIPAQKQADEPTVAEVRWESLIEFRDTGPLTQPAPAFAVPPRRKSPRIGRAIIAAPAFVVLALGVVIFLAIDNGRIKIVVEDPKAVVQIDGKEILIKALRESITLRAGEHELTVKWRDGQFETRKFVLSRGDYEELRVEYEPTLSDRKKTNGQTSPSTEKASSDPGLPKSFENSIGITLRLIPAGEFMMGSTPEQIEKLVGLFPEFKQEWGAAEQPQHRVRISRAFYLGAHEVTRGQFADFVRAANYKTEPERDGKGGSGIDLATNTRELGPKYQWSNTGFPQTDQHPVVNVTWNDAVAFCDWLSRKEGKTYRLPTEAEWEYACRAGTTTLYSTGDDPNGLMAVANLGGLADGFRFTAPVGSLRANGFGLFDMHGNVWEMCADWLATDYYANCPDSDPTVRLPAGVESAEAKRGTAAGRTCDQRTVTVSARRNGAIAPVSASRSRFQRSSDAYAWKGSMWGPPMTSSSCKPATSRSTGATLK